MKKKPVFPILDDPNDPARRAAWIAECKEVEYAAIQDLIRCTPDHLQSIRYTHVAEGPDGPVAVKRSLKGHKLSPASKAIDPADVLKVCAEEL